MKKILCLTTFLLFSFETSYADNNHFLENDQEQRLQRPGLRQRMAELRNRLQGRWRMRRHAPLPQEEAERARTRTILEQWVRNDPVAAAAHGHILIGRIFSTQYGYVF